MKIKEKVRGMGKNEKGEAVNKGKQKAAACGWT